MLEKDLYPIVAEYFRKKGYIVFVDDYRFFSYFGRRPDILAVDMHREEIIVVEVKIRPRISLKQLYRYMLMSDYTYLAIPFSMPLSDEMIKAMQWGVGIMRVHDDRVVITKEARRNEPLDILKDAVLYRVRMMTRSLAEK